MTCLFFLIRKNIYFFFNRESKSKADKFNFNSNKFNRVFACVDLFI